MASKRKVLALDERIKIIELCKTKSARKVAEELGVGKTLTFKMFYISTTF